MIGVAKRYPFAFANQTGQLLLILFYMLFKKLVTGVTHPRSQGAKLCFATMVCEQECVTSVIYVNALAVLET